jgi:Integral membrane protein TerC family
MSSFNSIKFLQTVVVAFAVACHIDAVAAFTSSSSLSSVSTSSRVIIESPYTLHQCPSKFHPPITRRRRGYGLSVAQQKNEFTEASAMIPGEINGDSAAQLLNSAGGKTTSPNLDEENDHMYETAIRRTIGWVAAAMVFGTGLAFFAGPETSEEFFAGYLLEQSLSIDNLLVFLLLFEYFKIPIGNQNRVLNWGIIGAIIMRAVMIGAGAVAIQKFRAVLLGFAAVLIVSSAKVIIGGDEDDEDDLSENQIVKFSNSLISSTDRFDGDRFFTEVDGIRKATPMLLCMVAVEVSDVVFAVDSIPAVFGVTEVRVY